MRGRKKKKPFDPPPQTSATNKRATIFRPLPYSLACDAKDGHSFYILTKKQNICSRDQQPVIFNITAQC